LPPFLSSSSSLEAYPTEPRLLQLLPFFSASFDGSLSLCPLHGVALHSSPNLSPFHLALLPTPPSCFSGVLIGRKVCGVIPHIFRALSGGHLPTLFGSANVRTLNAQFNFLFCPLSYPLKARALRRVSPHLSNRFSLSFRPPSPLTSYISVKRTSLYGLRFNSPCVSTAHPAVVMVIPSAPPLFFKISTTAIHRGPRRLNVASF